MRRAGLALALVCAVACGRDEFVALSAPPVAGEVDVSIDWTTALGAAGRLSYGVNAARGFEPAVAGQPGSDAYRTGIAATRAGFVRLYTFESVEDAAAAPAGWIDDAASAAPRWNRDKIARAFEGAYPHGPERMLTIPRWPVGLGPRTAPLGAAGRAAFITLCADLVRAVNVEQKRGVRLWEVASQLDGVYTSGRDLGALVADAAAAMRAVDPAIRVGGPGLQNAWWPELGAFLDGAASQIDFVSYHTYPFGAGSAQKSVRELVTAAEGLGSASANARAAIQQRTARAIELYHDELAMTSDASDTRLRGMPAALFAAAAFASIARGGATGAAVWNDASPDFGLLDGAFVTRPAGHAVALLNGFFRGAIAGATSSGDAVVVHAVRNERRRAVLLMNLSTSAWRAHISASAGALTARALRITLDESGRRSDEWDTARAAEGLRLGPLSLTAIIEGDRNPDAP